MFNEMFKDGILINLEHPPDAPLIILTTLKTMWFQPIDPYTREQSPTFLCNSNGRLDLPGLTQEAA